MTVLASFVGGANSALPTNRPASAMSNCLQIGVFQRSMTHARVHVMASGLRVCQAGSRTPCFWRDRGFIDSRGEPSR